MLRWLLQIKSVEQIWHRHCREREREHTNQLATMRTRLNTMKSQMSKLRREMAELETEIRCAEKNRVKEMARENELTERFSHGYDKVINRDDCSNQHISVPVDSLVVSAVHIVFFSFRIESNRIVQLLLEILNRFE